MQDSYLTSFMKNHLSPETMFDWLVDRIQRGVKTPKDDIELLNEYIYRLYPDELDEVMYEEDEFNYTFWARKGTQSAKYVLKSGNWLDLMFDSHGYKWDNDIDLLAALFHTVSRGYGSSVKLEIVEGENVL